MSESNTDYVDTPIPQPVQPKDTPTSRMVVVESIYHQIHEPMQSPQASGSQFVRWLSSDEQIYNPKRTIRVNQEWQEVDIGWCKVVGMIVITNLLKKQEMTRELCSNEIGVLEVSLHTITKVISTPSNKPSMWDEDREEQSGHVADILILPGESCRFTPVRSKQIAIRCREGEGLYSVVCIPE